MVIGIIISFLILSGVGYAIYKANKKFNKLDLKKEEEIEKEFNEGKILLPIDKRDFENMDEFESKTSHIESINKKIKSIDKDFEELKFKDFSTNKDN